MSIATRFVSSTARPRLDLAGCVLYAPLWRPDLGGSTFQSIGDQGIPTHLCTVTGATGGNQGRTFNGSSDKIDVPANAAFQGISVGAFTMWAWIKHSDATTGYDGIIMADLTTNGRGFILVMNNSSTSVGFLMRNTAGTTFFPEVVIADNTWTFLACTFDLSQLILSKDGVAGTPTAFTGSRAVAASVAVTLGLGEAGGRNFGGIIGEIGLSNGVKTAQEIMQIRLATKGRYV